LWYRKPFNNFGDYRWQCTWYCKGRVGEVLRINLNVTGNAGDWTGTYSSTANRVDANGNATGQTVTVHKETSGSNPRSGSVAVFKFWVSDGLGNADYFGHVLYVERVANGRVYYSDSYKRRESVVFADMTIGEFYTQYDGRDLPAGANSAFKGYLYV
jgi:hypothetical protein